MDDKKAIGVLMKLLKKRSLNDKEKEAIMAAIGILDLASLGANRMKSIINARKAKRNRSLEW